MPRGGKRQGAGRPKGTGKFGEPTKAVRLPISKIASIMLFIEQKCDGCSFCPARSSAEKSSAEEMEKSSRAKSPSVTKLKGGRT